MNKKCTLLAAAFMVASAFTASAAGVPVTDWTPGNYYYLQTTTGSASDPYYLSLSGERADSVIVKALPSNASKAAIDSALWEITSAGSETSGPVYQFKNKKTKAILSFAASPDASPILVSGVNKWAFSSTGVISAYNGGNELTLGAKVTGVAPNADTTVVLNAETTSNTLFNAFTVVAPDSKYALDASQLGNGFTVFQLLFGDTYQGNVFAGKEIQATGLTAADAGYVSLKVQGDETYPNGSAKLFGVDTMKTVISGAQNVFGAQFKLDSTYVGEAGGNPLHSFGNADFQKFKFTVDLVNDSLAMYVKAAPSVNSTLLDSIGYVRVVYASVADTKVLTVSKVTGADSIPDQGAAPLITVKKGTPAAIPTGTGVYFLKSASKTAMGGKYLRAYDNTADPKAIVMSDSVPTAFLPKGQWYIKENNGMYSIVDRNTNTSIIMNEEIFAVQGMANTYTFGANTDSITVEKSPADFANKFLGTRHFTVAEMANSAYALNLISGTSGVDNLYVTSSDSLLEVKAGSASNAIDLKLVLNGNDSIKYTGSTSLGARVLGDTLYYANYTLKEQFSDNVVALDATKKVLKLTSTTLPNVFTFNSAAAGGKYTMTTGADNVSLDINTSNLVLTGNVAYFNFVAVDAPEYASVSDGHKLFMSDGKYLVMNPLNFWAEMKIEGQPIVKADYIMDDFAFWMAKAASSTDAKPLYWISTVDPASAVKDATAPRYYMVSFADSVAANVPGYIDNVNNKNPRVGFVKRDSITIMANSPALFALKTTEDGYWLENQRDLSKNTGKPYVGIVNNVVVMANEGAPFSVESTSGPVDNEEINATEIIVTADVGTVTVQNALGKRVALSNILGQSVGTYQITLDRFTVPALRGVVIVAIEGETAHKVLVK